MTCAKISLELLSELNELARREDDPRQLRAFDKRLLLIGREGTGLLNTGDPEFLAFVIADATRLDASHDAWHLATLRDARAHPVDRVSTCLYIMYRLSYRALRGDIFPDEPGCWPMGDVTHDEAQRVLSRVLIDNPALLDPRLLVTVERYTTPDVSAANSHPTVTNPVITSVACAIAMTDFGSLPAERHGLAQTELESWIRVENVRHGLVSPARDPQTTQHVSTRLPVEVAGTESSILPGATRGAFLGSLLELSALAVAAGFPPLVSPAYESAHERKAPYGQAARVLWDYALWDGGATNLDFQDFLDAAQGLALRARDGTGALGRLFEPAQLLTARVSGRIVAQSDMLTAIADTVDLNLARRIAFDSLAAPTAPEVRRGVDLLCRLLVAGGVLPDHRVAARWLCDVVVGHGRAQFSNAGRLPYVDDEVALAFMEALVVLDADIDLSTEALAGRRQPSEPDEQEFPVLEHIHNLAEASWSAALDAVRVHQQMTKTLTAAQGQPQQANRATGAAPTKNPRRSPL